MVSHSCIFFRYTGQFYINGKIAGSRSVEIDIKNFRNNYIGKSKYDYDPNFKGSIKDFRLYNRELTYREILALAEKTSSTPLENLQGIVEKLRTYYHRQLLLSQGHIVGGYSPSLLLNMKKGSCNDYSVLGTHIFRSLGIPSAIDFSQQAGHDWNVLFLGDQSYDCSFIDNDTLGTHLKLYEEILPDRIAKIFRHTYAKQPDTPVMSGTEESFPESFRTPCIKDVSDLYLPTTDVSVTLDKKPPQDQQFAYLCFFLREWSPVHWSKHRRGKAHFTKMGNGVVYLPVYYHNNQTYPAAYPFALTLEGETRILKPDTLALQRLTLIRKYPEERVYQKDRLLGATFQVAQKEDFSDAQTIHTVDQRPEIRYNEVSVSLDKKYRYFRFMAPPRSNGGEICEIDLFDENGQKMEPYKIIGNYASPPDRTPESVFDGEPLTSYWCDQPDEGWVGVDFGKPVSIASFRFLPLNDDNFIRENELYELFYWDEQWVSLGRQTGTSSQYLEYNNAPGNALFC
ncbi:MAG: hypothetical protein LUE93_07115 [Bacteroides sp.]|nr:hypothetical protein [Bacteroides sp.]